MIDPLHSIRRMTSHGTSVFLVWTALLVLVARAHATTIYLDPSNSAGPWDGTSWPTAWSNVLDALSDLATTNAVVQGGHTVLFGAGTYPTFGINASHAGTAAASNYFRGTPGAILTRVDLSNSVGAVHFVLEDFEIDSSASLHGIDGRASCQDFLVRNCCFYGGNGIYLDHEYGCYFNNCTFAFGRYAYQNYSDVYYDNCVFVGNTPYGAYDNYSKKSRFRNCIFYGNGTANYRANLYDFNANTAEEIDGFTASSSNNIVANPGYVNMASGNRDFGAVYTNSPLLGNALDGGNVGHVASLSSVGFTQAVLYVDSATGNDANTRLQATNPATAWATISHAASNTTPGDTILVIAGAYPEQAFINVTGSGNEKVTICSVDGTAAIGGAAVGLTLDHCLGMRINVHADYNCYWDNGTAHFYDKDGFGFCTNEAQVNQMPDCSNNIVCNPSFKDPDIGDFRLNGGSCCIDAGEPNTLTKDFFGNHRPVGSGVDMGIYEMPPKGAIFTGL